MGLYAAFDDAQEPLASNAGWSELGAWIDGLDHEDCEEVVRLWEHAESQDVPALAAQLKAARAAGPPGSADARKTLDNLIALVAVHAEAGSVVVTNGMGPDDDDEDGATEAGGGSGVRALVDDNGTKHDDDGRFGDGGGGKKAEDKPADKKAGEKDEGKAGDAKTDDAGGDKKGDTGKVSDGAAALDKKAETFREKLASFGAKAKAAAGRVAEKVNHLAYNATWVLACSKVQADDILDTVHDYSKIINAKGTGDWLTQHVGVSGQVAANVLGAAASFGVSKFKAHMAARRAKAGKAAGGSRVRAAGGLSAREQAEAVAGVLAAIYGGLGCPDDELPTADAVAEWMDKREAANV